MTCIIKGCNKEAEFDVPTFLCEEHWQMWFDFKLKIPEHLKLKNLKER